MGFMDTGMAKSRAMASDARADLAEVNNKLLVAQTQAQFTGALDTLARKAANTWPARQELLSPSFEIITSNTGALYSRSMAEVDELRAAQASANSRLKFANKSQRAMNRLAEEGDRLLGDYPADR